MTEEKELSQEVIDKHREAEMKIMEMKKEQEEKNIQENYLGSVLNQYLDAGATRNILREVNTRFRKAQSGIHLFELINTLLLMELNKKMDYLLEDNDEDKGKKKLKRK